MAKKGLTQANTLRSNNTTSTGYGIVYADEIIGSRSVKTKEDLNKLPDWVLGKDNKLEKGTTYYVENEKCFYIYTGDGWQKSFKSIGLPVKSWYAYNNDVTGTAATSQILDISKIIKGDDLYVGTLDGIEEQPHPFATIVVYNDEVNKVPIAYITLFESSDPDNPENNTVVASAKVFGVITKNVFPKTPDFNNINYYEGNCRPLDTGTQITNWRQTGGVYMMDKIWELNNISFIGNPIKTSDIDFTAATLQKFNNSISDTSHNICAQYSVVDTTHNNIVGQMLLIGDSLGHMVTEILTTSATLKDGVINWNEHSDTVVNTYIRRNHVKEGGTSSIAVGSWSTWTYYSGEGQYNEFKKLVAGELNKKVNTSDVVQQTGDSTTSVMSQRAVSDKLSDLTSTISYLNCDNPSIFIQGAWGNGVFNSDIKKRISLNGIRYGINAVLKEGYKYTASCWFKDNGTYIAEKYPNTEIDNGYLCLSIAHVDDSDISTDEYPFESCSLGLDFRSSKNEKSIEDVSALGNIRYKDLSKLKYCIPDYELGKTVAVSSGVINNQNNRAIIKNISMPTILKVGDGYSIYNAILFKDNMYYSTDLYASIDRKEAQLLKCINQCYYYVTINKNDGTKFTENDFKDAIVEFSRDYAINQNVQKSIKDNLCPDLITIEGSAPNATTGIFNLTSGYKRTDFIPVDLIGEKGIEFKNTTSSSSFASYYYDANKRPISKVFQSTGVIEKGIIQKADMPENCAYIVLIFPKDSNYDVSCRILNPINEVVYSNIDTFLLKEKTPYILFDSTYLCNNSFIGNYGYIKFDSFKNIKFKAMEIRGKRNIGETFISFRDKNKNQISFYNSSNNEMSTIYIPFEGIYERMNNWEKLDGVAIRFDEGTVEELNEYYIKLYYDEEVCDKNLNGFDDFVYQYAQRWSNFHCLPYMAKYYNKGDNDKYYFNLFIDTDTHKETNNVFRRVLQWCRYVKVRDTNPIYISLGDFGQVLLADRPAQSKTVWKSYMKSMFDVIDTYGYNTDVPQLFTVGNHDTNQEKNNWKNIEYFARKSDLYENIFKPMLARYSSNHTQLDTENKFANYKKIAIVTDSENDSPTYYYFDSEEHKVRVIVCNVYDIEDSRLSADLNSNSGDNSEAYVLSQMQLDFIYNAMKGAEEKGYCVILCGHSFTSTNSMNVLRDFAVAYRNKTTATSTLNSTNKIYNIDFSRASGKIFYLQGHGHKFVRSKHKNTNIGTLEVDNFMTIATCGTDTHFLRDKDEDCFDILCYDDSEGIKFVRYGNANGMYDSNNNDGSDSNGFHFVDDPIKFEL